MFRKMLFAVVPMVFAVSLVSADDTFNLNLADISDAAVEIEDLSLAGVDVDGLTTQAGSEDSEDAIEACFRRFGYGYGGYHCYRPYYNYCYPSYYCYRPVHYYTYPVVTYFSYWGCY